MMLRIRLAAVVAASTLLPGCRTAQPPSAMTSYVPTAAIAVAGLNLEQLRNSPLYPNLPPAVNALLEPFHDARSLMAASAGKDLLLIAAGKFAAPPPGSTIVAPGLALAGSPESIAAATAPHNPPALLTYAEPVAAGKQLWIVVQGDATLPLSGNAANVNRMLRNMEFAALTVRLESPIEFAIAARGRTPEAALHFEQTLRATLTMAAAAESKQSGLAALLHAVQLRREDRTVHATLNATNEQARKLLALLSP